MATGLTRRLENLEDALNPPPPEPPASVVLPGDPEPPDMGQLIVNVLFVKPGQAVTLEPDPAPLPEPGPAEPPRRWAPMQTDYS